MIAILYATKYGSTERIAGMIRDGLVARGTPGRDVVLERIDRPASLPDAATVVVGAPIYGGTIPRAARGFIEAHVDELLERRVALFLSCLYEGSRAEQQLADNFPARLVAHAFGRYYPGSRLVLSDLRFFDRLIMKKVGGIERDVDTVKSEEIGRIVDDLLAQA